MLAFSLLFAAINVSKCKAFGSCSCYEGNEALLDVDLVSGLATETLTMDTHHITVTPYRMEKRQRETYIDLTPQTADLNIKNAGVGIELIVPDCLHLAHRFCYLNRGLVLDRLLGTR